MKNIFDLVIRFMAISAMLVGVSLAMVATAPEAVAAKSAVSELVAVESESVSEMTELPMVDTYAQSDDEYDPKLLHVHVLNAIQRHDYNRLQQLINAGADLNYRSDGEYNKRLDIFYHVENSYAGTGDKGPKLAYKMVKFLLDNGAKINGPTGQDTTLLDIAILWQDVNLAKLAVAHGADLNGGNAGKRKQSYLFDAHSFKMLEYLLESGVNPNVVNSKVWGTPFISNVFRFPRSQEVIDRINILLAYGADPNLPDAYGKTALDYAKERVDIDMVEFLKNAKPGSRSDSKAKTPAKDKSDNGDKSEDKVASPKKSESKVPSYGTAGDCADFMQDTPPDISRAILNILKRHKVSCYTVPDQCEDLLKGESPDIRKKLKVALGTLRIYCYQ